MADDVAHGTANSARAQPQGISAPLTKSAIFLVCAMADDDGAAAIVRGVLSDIAGLVKTVSFRDSHARLTCTVGIGSRAWGPLTGRDHPAELHPFREIAGATHTAVATAGDLLFHIRADRQDLCFELARLLLEALGTAVTVADEVSGFRYFDARDLLGFVDGTANPTGLDLPEAVLVGEEDPAFAGGSYVVVQKYLHPLPAWQRLTTEQQEAIMGRRKADNVELGDAVTGQKSHKTLTTITDDAGEYDILRDNMPFGRPGSREFGTYFIGYARHLWVIERMLERMFIGDPPGLHDRLLDFSTAHTGTTFFAPSETILEELDRVTVTANAVAGPATPKESQPLNGPHDTSLGIGSLKNPPGERNRQ